MSRVQSDRYSKLIGYNFGSDCNGNDRIYNGVYRDSDTGKKQYEFLYYDRGGKLVASELTDYKGFRKIINQFDYPKK